MVVAAQCRGDRERQLEWASLHLKGINVELADVSKGSRPFLQLPKMGKKAEKAGKIALHQSSILLKSILHCIRTGNAFKGVTLQHLGEGAAMNRRKNTKLNSPSCSATSI